MKKKMKWSQVLKALLLNYLTLATIASQIAVFLISTKVSLFPGQEAMQSIAGSFAEIVAGLYGLTLASYTFFLSRIDGLAASNHTLEYVTNGLKRGFKYLIWHITFQVLMTLVFATALMYATAPEVGSAFAFWYRLFCNEFIAFAGFSVVLILYYSILVVNPKCIEKEAARLKKKLGGKENDGSLLEFLALHQKLCRRIEELLPKETVGYLHAEQVLTLAVAMALLRQLHPEIEELLPELEAIYRYYECLVNCKDVAVSQSMCDRANRLLDQLDALL